MTGYGNSKLVSEEFFQVSVVKTAYDDGTYPENFWPWLLSEPHIYVEFVRLARDLRDAGVKRWAAAGIIQVLRWQTAIREKGQSNLKINDHAGPGMARLAMAMYPELDGFFSVRTNAKQQARKLDGKLYSEQEPAPE